MIDRHTGCSRCLPSASRVTIADGGLACTPEQLRVSRNAAWGSLTGREREVLDGVVQGRSNDEIGGDLGLSKKSVEAYVSRLLARYGALSRTELAVHGERSRVLDLPVSEAARRRG